LAAISSAGRYWVLSQTTAVSALAVTASDSAKRRLVELPPLAVGQFEIRSACPGFSRVEYGRNSLDRPTYPRR
jgi:hypothetical protein